MRARLHVNTSARPRADLGPFSPPTREPLGLHRRLPGYAPTPLRRAPELAADLGVREVYVKDESARLGLPSYKFLGASWATYCALTEELGVDPGPWASVEELRETLRPLGDRALAAATDGNHGRAVARMARLLGWSARIFVPAGTAAARVSGIEGEGASVTVVDGTYDEAVERAAQEAAPDVLVISDTAWPGYETTPRHVVEGYSTIFWEVDDELQRVGLPHPSTVVAQMGVGALAAAAVRHYRSGGAATAHLVGVEPRDADCVLASVAAGHEVEVPGPHRSAMAGLNCGRPSPLALPLVLSGMDAFLAVDDAAADRAVRALAAVGITSGESGAAGLAGLLAVAAEGTEQERAAVGLLPDAVVLTVSTEGATDPVNYARILAGA